MSQQVPSPPARSAVTARVRALSDEGTILHAITHVGTWDAAWLYLVLAEADYTDPDGEPVSMLKLRYAALGKDGTAFEDTWLTNGINMRAVDGLIDAFEAMATRAAAMQDKSLTIQRQARPLYHDLTDEQ